VTFPELEQIYKMSAAATIATVCAETAENLNRTALVMGKGIVELLASKYGFDAAEAFEAISFEVPKKAKKAAAEKKEKGEKVKKVKIPLPFVGIVNAEWCLGIRANHGLFTQCTNAKPKDGSEYCPTCAKQAQTNATGKPTYGNINDRAEAFEAGMEWRDPKENKAVANYGNVAAKLKIDIEAANAECLSVFGVAIPDDQLEVKAAQRGRPKANVIVSDTDSATSTGEKKKSGRPKKVKAVLEGGAAGDDLIAGLVAEAQEGSDAKPKKAKAELTPEEKEAKKKEAAEKRKATLEKKKAENPKPELSEEEKEAKKKEAAEKRKEAKKAKELAYIQAAVQAALVAQGLSSAAPSTAGSESESEKHKTPTPKKSVVTKVFEDEPEPEPELEIEDLQSDDDDEESAEVRKWTCPLDGKVYLKTDDNLLYDVDTQEPVGVWNAAKKVIEDVNQDDEDDGDYC
jgi:hypothetical protein